MSSLAVWAFAALALATDSPSLDQSLKVTGAPVEPRASSSSGTVRQLPLASRTRLLDHVGAHTPGVLQLSSGLSIHGGDARETALFLDDARLNRLALPITMIDRLDVYTAGYGLQLADVTGGAIAARSARESPKLGAEVAVVREMDRREDNVVGGAVALPILRERLFLRLAADHESERWDGISDAEGILPTLPDVTRKTLRAAGKLTWVPVPGRQRVELLGALGTARRDNEPRLGLEREAQPRFDDEDLLLSARWLGMLTPALGARLQLLAERNQTGERTIDCEGPSDDCPGGVYILTYPRRTQGLAWSRHGSAIDRAFGVSATVEAMLPRWRRVHPSLRFTSRLRASDRNTSVSVPGNQLLEYQAPAVPLYRYTYFSSDPRLGEAAMGGLVASSSLFTNVQALEAPLVVHTLRVTPGLALVGARARTIRGDRLNEVLLAPGLSASWMLLANRLSLRAASHRRIDASLDRLSPDPATPFARRCSYDPSTGEYSSCEILGGLTSSTTGLPCGPLGVDAAQAPCRGAIALPAVWEHTIGAGFAPLDWLRLDLDVVERRSGGRFVTNETNRIWNASGQRVEGYQNGRTMAVTDVSAHPDAEQRHRSWHARLGLTPGPVQASVSFVRSHDWTAAPTPPNAPRQYELLAQPGRHFVYLQTATDVGDLFSFGVLYTWAQGAAAYWVADPRGYDNYRATRGINPGANINDPGDDRTPPRRPSSEQISLQLRARGKRLIGADLDLYLDAMHLMDNKLAFYASDVSDDRRFTDARPTQVWFRLGVEYRY